MEKKYEKPEIEIVEFEFSDVISEDASDVGDVGEGGAGDP